MARQVPFPLPVRGLHKGAAYGQQPQGTSPDLCNVRAFEAIEHRLRIGQRPGLGKLYPEELGSGTDVRMLGQVTAEFSTTGDYTFDWEDDFVRDGDDLGPGWTQPSWWATEAPTRVTMMDPVTAASPAGGVLDAIEVDVSSVYTVSMRIVPWEGEHWGTYYLWVRMDDTTPNLWADGVEVVFEPTGNAGAYTAKVNTYVGSTKTAHSVPAGATGSADAAWLTMDVTGDNAAVYWDGTLLWVGAVGAAAGSRMGFGVRAPEFYWPDATSLVDVFRVSGSPTSAPYGSPRRTYLVASAGNTVYHEATIGSLTSVCGDVANLADDHRVLCSERLQKLYIADWGTRGLQAADGAIDVTGYTLSATSVDDWTAYDVNADTDVVVITGATGGVIAGTYEISSVAAGGIVLYTSAGTSGSCAYRVERAAKIYDPKAEDCCKVTVWGTGKTCTASGSSAGNSSSSGTGGTLDTPVGCPLVCTYRDRMVLAGWPRHQWYMSRQGDPLDWDTEETDDQAAVSGASSDAGQIGDILTALIPFRDQYLFFGCKGSMWLLRGDAQTGGVIDAISYTIGVISPGAICQGSGGEVYFLSANGLYGLAPGATAIRNPFSTELLVPLSPDVLPLELQDINPDQVEVTLGWDARNNGVHVYLTPKDTDGTAQVSHWFYDLKAGGFFPQTHTADHSATATLNYQTPIPAYRQMLVGGQDGYVRSYDPVLDRDDGVAITSYAVFGPAALARGGFNDGRLQQLVADIAKGSGDIAWELRVGASAEEAVKESAAATGTWRDLGRVHVGRPRVRGQEVVLKVSNAEEKRWALERVLGVATDAGRTRRG